MKKRPSESTAGSEKISRHRRKYDEEFKQQALALIRNGQSTRSVAEALGVSEGLIHRWKRAARALPEGGEDEVEQLRRRLKQVEMERDILKKALSIFSRQT
jgi:transposase